MRLGAVRRLMLGFYVHVGRIQSSVGVPIQRVFTPRKCLSIQLLPSPSPPIDLSSHITHSAALSTRPVAQPRCSQSQQIASPAACRSVAQKVSVSAGYTVPFRAFVSIQFVYPRPRKTSSTHLPLRKTELKLSSLLGLQSRLFLQ
jgi:hypothetical protein